MKPLIDAMLVEDLTAPRRQRHTARRVLAQLGDEHGATNLIYASVRSYVSRRRPQIAAEAGVELERAFVWQTHPPGAEAEVDYGDMHVMLDGVMTKCFLFTLRLSSSGKACHQVFASQGQEAFIEGHVDAFTRLGGVPFDKIRYDNLRSAVSRVLFGRGRDESARWVPLRSHYGFDAFYCRAGVVGANEKGGVDGEVGRFLRNPLTPVRSSRPWPSSTPGSWRPTPLTMPGGSRTGSAQWGSTSPLRRRCYVPCRRTVSMPGCG